MVKFDKKYQIWQYSGFDTWTVSGEFDTVEEAIMNVTRENYGGREWAITSRVDIDIKEKS